MAQLRREHAQSEKFHILNPFISRTGIVYEGENIGARVLSQTFWYIFWYIDWLVHRSSHIFLTGITIIAALSCNAAMSLDYAYHYVCVCNSLLQPAWATGWIHLPWITGSLDGVCLITYTVVLHNTNRSHLFYYSNLKIYTRPRRHQNDKEDVLWIGWDKRWSTRW